MKMEYIISYNAPYDEELFTKLAKVAQEHIDPYTNGAYMTIGVYELEYRDDEGRYFRKIIDSPSNGDVRLN